MGELGGRSDRFHRLLRLGQQLHLRARLEHIGKSLEGGQTLPMGWLRWRLLVRLDAVQAERDRDGNGLAKDKKSTRVSERQELKRRRLART